MDLAQHIESLRNDLVAAAAVGGADSAEVADRLVRALDPALRLTLLEALAQAADEITAELEDTVVSVRIEGREPRFAIDALPGSATTPPPPPAEGEDDIARVTLRLPESLKTQADVIATSTGVSLNAWIVDAIRAAIATPTPAKRGGAKRLSGWI